MAKPNTDFVDDVPEVNTDFVDDVAPAPEGPTDFIAKAKAEGRAEELPNGLVRVQAPDKSFSQVFDAATGQYVATPEDLKSIQQGTASRSKVEGLKSLLGMAQAVSPFGDEGAAKMREIWGALNGEATTYDSELAKIRKDVAAAEEQTPLALKLGAGLGSAVLGGGLGSKIFGAPAATMAAAAKETLLKALIRQAPANAVSGAAQGYGMSESDTVGGQLLDTAKGTVWGTGLGAGAQLLSGGAAATANAVAPSVKKMGQRAYLKSAGLYAGIKNALAGIGKGVESIDDVVNNIRQSGIIKPGMDTEDVYKAAKQVLDEAAGERRSVIAAIDEKGRERLAKQVAEQLDVADNLEMKAMAKEHFGKQLKKTAEDYAGTAENTAFKARDIASKAGIDEKQAILQELTAKRQGFDDQAQKMYSEAQNILEPGNKKTLDQFLKAEDLASNASKLQSKLGGAQPANTIFEFAPEGLDTKQMRGFQQDATQTAKALLTKMKGERQLAEELAPLAGQQTKDAQRLLERSRVLAELAKKSEQLGPIKSSKLAAEMQRVIPKDGIGKISSKPAEEMVSAIRAKPNMSAQEAVEQKMKMQDLINWSLEAPAPQQMKKQAEAAYRSGLGKQFSEISPDLATKYEALNQKMANVFPIFELSGEEALRKYGRQALSLGDAAKGGIVGGVPGAAIALGSAATKGTINSRIAEPLMQWSENLAAKKATDGNQLYQNYIQKLMQPKEEKQQEAKEAYLSQE